VEDSLRDRLAVTEVLSHYPFEQPEGHAAVPDALGIYDNHGTTRTHAQAGRFSPLHALRAEEESLPLEQTRKLLVQFPAFTFRRAEPAGADQHVPPVRVHSRQARHDPQPAAILRRMTEQQNSLGAPGTHTSEAGAPSFVSVAWGGDQRFEFGRPNRPWVTLDGRGQAGPSPFDALLGAIASCAAIDVVVILEKRRTPARSLQVEVVAMRAEGVPRRMLSAELHFRIAGAGIEKEQAERAIDMSINKYCSVRSSLDPGAPVSWTLALSE